ncbi:MAG: ABC transporter substrate-binding protein, partial [Peptococcaceae bacterium]|jgi:ABC-type transport system substrate-binding protein|nr:ABC transporter substrate-binding protein [Peptococcaceae bacterium]
LYYVRIAEQLSGVSAQIAGDIDAYFPAGGISPDFFGMYAGTEDRIGMRRAEGNGLFWIAFNFTGDSVFNDDNVRHALDLAIDRRALAKSLWPGVDIEPLISNGFFNENTIGYDPTIPKPEFDPDKARELMANSSYDGRVLSMLTAGTSATWEQMAMAIQDWLGAVGIKVDARLDSGASFFAAIANGDYDILLTMISFPDGIPFRQLNRIVTNLDKQNYVNDELYGYINGFLTEIDDEKREEFVRKANRFIFENKAPDIALTYRYTIYPINLGLVGIEFGRDTNAIPTFVDWDPSLVP